MGLQISPGDRNQGVFPYLLGDACRREWCMKMWPLYYLSLCFNNLSVMANGKGRGCNYLLISKGMSNGKMTDFISTSMVLIPNL